MVGIIPACLLENLEEQGLIKKGLIRIVHQKKDSPLDCRHSTDLFPDISLWAAEGTPREEVKDLTIALYKTGGDLSRQWVPNVSERRIMELFERLKEGPYRIFEILRRLHCMNGIKEPSGLCSFCSYFCC